MALGFNKIASPIGEHAEISMRHLVIGLGLKCTLESDFSGVNIFALKRCHTFYN